MTEVAAPVIKLEMADWVKKGGGNSGIVGNGAHTYGFHRGANKVPSTDYSRYRDPKGADGPYVDWDYACAGDFDHKNNPKLRKLHADVLHRLMAGEFPMICEFIGKPFADKPVYYWARWNGIKTLQKYTGAGHDHWSHISWYRSTVNKRAYLWVPSPSSGAILRRKWPSYMPSGHYFGLITGPDQSHGGYYQKFSTAKPDERPDIKAIQVRLIKLGYVPGVTSPTSKWVTGIFEKPTKDAVTRWQKAKYASTTTRFGEVWSDDWRRLFTY
jgi:Putative peptidoglycan binding domain